jgi:hypothetical protein
LSGGMTSAPPVMICSERERLLQAYHDAVAAYADVVSRLKLAQRTDFPRQFAMADAARENCNRLRDRLMEHRAHHGC